MDSLSCPTHCPQLPFLIIGAVVSLVLVVAVVRAAASTRSQHSGPLCFLAKLGISIGSGCGRDGAPAIVHVGSTLTNAFH